jgi:hypothetical protein
MDSTDVVEIQTLTSQQVVDLTRQYNYGTWLHHRRSREALLGLFVAADVLKSWP